MNETLKTIERYIDEPIDGLSIETVELNGSNFLFSLRSFEAAKEESTVQFLQGLRRYIHPEFKIDEEGSGIYFFKTGATVIELDISINETVKVTPYLSYEGVLLPQDFERIVYLDHLLYCILKKHGLQPEKKN